jgi:hypothetical protein
VEESVTSRSPGFAGLCEEGLVLSRLLVIGSSLSPHFHARPLPFLIHTPPFSAPHPSSSPRWRPLLQLRLGYARGSVATVEALVVPLAVGLVAPPRLVLKGLQDVVEESTGWPDQGGGSEGLVLVTV